MSEEHAGILYQIEKDQYRVREYIMIPVLVQEEGVAVRRPVRTLEGAWEFANGYKTRQFVETAGGIENVRVTAAANVQDKDDAIRSTEE